MLKNILTAGVAGAAGIAVAWFIFGGGVPQNLGGGQGFTAHDCAVDSSTKVDVGDDISQQVVSAHSRRAYARIQQPNNATNTVFLSFDEGADATVGQGTQLTNSTTSLSAIEFGLNADFQYTGAVTAITNNGSTTVLVTDCQYNR